jgi:hypothetical protein
MEPIVTMTPAEYFGTWKPWLLIVGVLLQVPTWILLGLILKKLP